MPLIEDAAQAFGTRFADRPVGSFGDAGIYSFGMYKNINSFFGGMIVTPRADLAERLRTEVKGFPPQEIGYYLTKVMSGVASDLATWPPLFRTLTYPVFRYGFLHDVGLLNQQVSVDADPQMKRELPESYLRERPGERAAGHRPGACSARGKREEIPMRYEPVRVRDGDFALDWAVTRQIVKSYVVAKAAAKGRVRPDEDSGLFGAPVYSYRVDWRDIQKNKSAWTEAEFSRFLDYLLNQGGRAAQQKLLCYARATHEAKKSLRKSLRTAQHQTAAGAERAILAGKIGEETARFVRDTAIDGLAIGAGILAGPAVGTVVKAAVGGTLKGAAKYADTKNLGAAVYTANTSLIFELIPAPGASKAGNVALLLVKVGADDVLGGVIEGKSVADSLADGALSVGMGSAGTALGKNKKFQKWLRSAVVPGSVGLASKPLLLKGKGTVAEGLNIAKLSRQVGGPGTMAGGTKKVWTTAADLWKNGTDGPGKTADYGGVLGEKLKLAESALVPLR